MGWKPIPRHFRNSRLKRGLPESPSRWFTVAGIVTDIHQGGLEVPPRPELYLLYDQVDYFEPQWLAVRTVGDPMSMAESIRQQIWAVDKEQPVSAVMPLEELLDDSLASRRVQTFLLSGFALVALLLAALGIYAVLSFTVTARTQEIGVRVALGAEPGSILRMVLLQGFVLFLIGASLGLGATIGLSHLLVHVVYGISPSDPLSFGIATLLLSGTVLLACYLPARRAMRMNACVALRYE